MGSNLMSISLLRLMPEVLDSKMVDISPSFLMQAVIISFIGSQLTSEWLYYLTGMIMMPVVLCGIIPGFMNHNNNNIYMETAIALVIPYVSLLIINWSYIWLVVFPVIAIGFIFALWNELNHQGGSGSQGQQQCNVGEATSSARKKPEGLEAVALVPYWVICIMSWFDAGKLFTVSQFLLFFGSMLGTLTLMMTRLALIIVDGRGIAQASELIRKAIPLLLLWFSVHLHRDMINLVDRNNALILQGAPAVVLAFLAAGYMDELLLYWCTKALVAFVVSGLLMYCVVFMMWQWPEPDTHTLPSGTTVAKETVTLLKLWANVLLIVAATFLVLSLLVSILR